MRCEKCLLEDPNTAALSIETFQEQLRKCTECPHMKEGPSAPIVALLSKQHAQAGRALRTTASKLRQLKNELDAQRKDFAKHEERMTKLELMHRASSLQLEEQIQAAKSADAARNRFVTILRTTTDFVMMYDAQLTPTFLNHAVRAAMSFTMESEASDFTLHDIHGKATISLLENAFPQAREHGVWVGDTELNIPGGHPVPISLSIHVHRNDERKIIFYSTIGRDISAYKEIDQLKGEFISTVSHELRTPLTAIRGSLGLLEGGIAGELPDMAREMVTIALENSERLIRLVNDLLDLEKMNSGKMELRKAPHDISHLIANAVRDLSATAQAAGITIVIERSSLIQLNVDGDRITQVLVNLIGNAIKFSPENSIVEIGTVELATSNVRVHVRDHGAGIARDDLDRLFRKFSQVDASANRRRGGTGLGLAISKMLVELHAGTIGVSSELGKGTTFWFELPM
jgi:signal transduction histidine kinase